MACEFAIDDIYYDGGNVSAVDQNLAAFVRDWNVRYGLFSTRSVRVMKLHDFVVASHDAHLPW